MWAVWRTPQRAFDDLPEQLLIGAAVGLAHAHAAEADRRDLKALLAELAVSETHILSSCLKTCG
jgi:hypothetical protein